jgi:hypothetical protein
VSKLAMTLCGATGLAACLLLHGATEEISSEPRPLHQAAKSSRPDPSAWNAFSSESRRVSSMRGRTVRAAPAGAGKQADEAD